MLTRVHPITRISLLHLCASSLANFIYFVLVKWYIVDLDRLGVSIGSSGAIELFIGDKMYRTDGLSRLAIIIMKVLITIQFYGLSLRLLFSPRWFFFDGRWIVT